MKYYPQGWKKFRFIIAPHEMEQVLSGLHHVVFNCCVPADYKETDPETFHERYRALYEKLSSGYALEWPRDYRYFDARTGLTNDLSCCPYSQIMQNEDTGEPYKRAEFEEPCVAVDPFVLIVDQNGKLCSQCSYYQFPAYTIGMELQYPKHICRFSRETEGIEALISCSDLETYKAYESIVGNVKGIAHKLVFTIHGKKHRPDVWISKWAENDFQHFYFAKHYGIEL